MSHNVRKALGVQLSVWAFPNSIAMTPLAILEDDLFWKSAAVHVILSALFNIVSLVCKNFRKPEAFT